MVIEKERSRQQILKEENWTSNTSDMTSEERETILTEETTIADTKIWLILESEISMIQYTGLH